MHGKKGFRGYITISADPYFDIFLNPELNMLHVKPTYMSKPKMMMKEAAKRNETFEKKVCAEWFCIF